MLHIDGEGAEKGTGYFSGDSYKISQFRFLVQIASESCSDFLQFEIVGLSQWSEVCGPTVNIAAATNEGKEFSKSASCTSKQKRAAVLPLREHNQHG